MQVVFGKIEICSRYPEHSELGISTFEFMEASSVKDRGQYDKIGNYLVYSKLKIYHYIPMFKGEILKLKIRNVFGNIIAET